MVELDSIDFNKLKQQTPTYPYVSVIVLNYNGMAYLPDLFDSLKKTDYPEDRYEIIMGDNGSSDNSVKFMHKNFPFVKIVEFDKNYGFCKGNNLCVDKARGQYLVFLNTDMIVTSNWLKNLVTSISGKTNVVSAGAKLLKQYEVNGKNIIDYAGGKLTYEINFYEGQFDCDGPKYSIQKNTGFGCGAAVIFEKSFFVDVGGFDEYYFGGGEEVELGFRAWQYGFKVIYVPSSVIYHLRSGTFKSTDPFPTYAWVKSMFYFILKNYEGKNVVFYLSESILFTHFPKILAFLFNKNLLMAKAVTLGMLHFLIDLKKENTLLLIYEKRAQIKINKKKSDKDLSILGITTSFSERTQYRINSYKHWKTGQ